MFLVHIDFYDIVLLAILTLMAVFIFFSYCSEWMYRKSKRRDKDDT